MKKVIKNDKNTVCAFSEFRIAMDVFRMHHLVPLSRPQKRVTLTQTFWMDKQHCREAENYVNVGMNCLLNDL